MSKADWIAQASALATDFRLGNSVSAALSMVEFVRTLLAAEGAGLSADHQQQLAALVGELLSAQERQDWLGLADTLEVDLVDWLNRVKA